jgi:alcohol oxidase
VRVLIDYETKRAVGVELRTNTMYNPDAAGQPLRVVKARKLVVASSGACGTLSLLEQPGLGDSKVLERSGVPVIVDLPGVVNDYKDHHLVCDISFYLLLFPRESSAYADNQCPSSVNPASKIWTLPIR